jgi:VCBS repeat-containing protein
LLEDRKLLSGATLYGGASSVWSIVDNAMTSNGLPAGGDLMTGADGSGAAIADASIVDRLDSYDCGSMVWVANTQIGGAITVSGNSVTFKMTNVAGLDVQMKYQAITGRATLRNFVTFTNPTRTAVSVPVDFVTNFGSDWTTAVTASSSGDSSFTPADRWIITDDLWDGVFDPANTTVFYGPGSPSVTPSSVSQTVFRAKGTQGARACYDITVPAGETRGLLFFHQLHNRQIEAAAAATIFDAPPTADSELLVGLAPAQLDQVLNWELGQRHPPVANTDTYTTDEDSPLVVSAPGVLANDSDPDGGPLTVVAQARPIHGTLELNDDGSFSYTPDGNFNGADSFTYVVTDPEGCTDTATVTIMITAVNDAPAVTVPGKQAAPEDVAVSITGISVSDTDLAEGSGQVQVTLGVQSGNLSVAENVAGGLTSTQISMNGSASVVLAGAIEAINATLGAGVTYLSNTNFSGDDILTVTANDLGNTGKGGSLAALATVAIEVLSPEQQAKKVTDRIESLKDAGILNSGQAKSLSNKFDLKGNSPAVLNRIGAFINHVESLIAEGVLTEKDGRELIAAAEDLMTALSTG